VAILIERGQVVLETARTITRWHAAAAASSSSSSSGSDGDEAEVVTPRTPRVAAALCVDGRAWIMEQQEWELRVLEDREMELLHTTELRRAQLADLYTVLQRQATLHAQRRARWDTAAEAAAEAKEAGSPPPPPRKKRRKKHAALMPAS
jgi:hypothetical protein